MEASIDNATQILSREKKKSHYEPRLVLQIIAIGFGSTAFGYASAVIAPTLCNVELHLEDDDILD
jgi:hypothetical protein